MKELMLSNGQITQVDDCDLMFLLGVSATWHLDHWGYVAFWGSYKRKKHTIYMHKEIAKRMGLNIFDKTDHKDCNKLNNQRDNIREATHSQNLMNRGAQKNNTLGLKNICFVTSRNKWQVLIQKSTNGIRENLFMKQFKTLEEAIEARDIALIKFHGKYANFD